MPLARTGDSVIGDLIKIIIAVFLPPIAVLLEVGLGKHFWINLVLVFFFFIPAVIHAIYIVATR
jgi:uncharacterized membrane protein YqaE (UPF0057 family)